MRPENDFVHAEVENVEVLKRRCLMYNVGLMEIEKFEYSFRNGLFNVDISAEDILPDVSLQERKNLLNYALILNEPYDSE
jgi:hypothetical protein